MRKPSQLLSHRSESLWTAQYWTPVRALVGVELHLRSKGDASQTIDFLWIVTEIGGEGTSLSASHQNQTSKRLKHASRYSHPCRNIRLSRGYVTKDTIEKTETHYLV